MFLPAKDLQAAGLYLLKKKDEDLFTGVTRSKNNKRSKRDKRKQNAVSHNSLPYPTLPYPFCLPSSFRVRVVKIYFAVMIASCVV